MSEQRLNVNGYVNEIEILSEFFDEIERHFPAIWHPANEQFYAHNYKRVMFEQLLGHLEMRFPGRIPGRMTGKLD